MNSGRKNLIKQVDARIPIMRKDMASISMLKGKYHEVPIVPMVKFQPIKVKTIDD